MENNATHYSFKVELVRLSWLNPLIIAIVPTLIVILLQTLNFNKFTTTKIEQFRFGDRLYVKQFIDFEHDNNMESVYIGDDAGSKHCFIFIYNEDDNLLGQINLKHPYAKMRETFLPQPIDVTGDGIDELIVFTQKKDSLFLNVLSFSQHSILRSSVFVTTIGGYNDALDYRLYHVGNVDATEDGIPEFYFAVMGAFALYPRCLFRYDFVKNSISASVNTGSSYVYGQIANKDDHPRIFYGGVAYGNVSKSYPYVYHDTCCWLLGFDKDLNEAFKGVPFGTYPSYFSNIHTLGDSLFFLLRNKSAESVNMAYLTDFDGNIIKSKDLGNMDAGKLPKFRYKNKDYYIIKRGVENVYNAIDPYTFEIFTPTFLKKLKGLEFTDINIDITGDFEHENVFYDIEHREIKFFNSELKYLYKLALVDNDLYFKTLSAARKDNYTSVYVLGDNNFYNYRINHNPWFWLRYPFYIAVYLLSTLFVSIITYFQNKQYRKQQDAERQIADLQLQNLRNQIDPHFTFNALNSVANAIYKEDRKVAYDLFQQFTSLIRSSLTSSGSVFVPLSEELEFTINYLKFQKMRFKTMFDFTVSVDPRLNLDDYKIPKLLLQSLVENSVKHAFYKVDYTGLISISILRAGEGVHIIAKDNGIGRYKSMELAGTSGTKIGSLLILKQLAQINRLYNTRIRLRYLDAFGEEDHGTTITIEM